MALTRKFLSAMGIDEEKIDEIINAHRETVDALKEERDAYKEDAEKLPDIQKELDVAKKQIEKAVAEDSQDKWKVKYDAMREEFDSYKSSISAKETKQKKTDAYRNLLKETGVSEKRLAAVLRVTNLDDVEFDEEGKLKETDRLKENIRKEWGDFITTTETKGADTETPPGGAGGADGAHTPSRAAQIVQKRYERMYGKQEGDN